MPPVRWKVEFYVAAAIFVQLALAATAQQMQDSISMSSDGWRPIVGTRRQPIGSDFSSTHRVYQSETTLPPYSQKSPNQPYKSPAYKERKQAPKTKLVQKTGNSYYLPSGPASASSSSVKKLQAINKPVTLQNTKLKKVVKGQMVAHSTRNEVFLPPPHSNIGGAYSYIKSIPPSSVKTREAQGFGVYNNNFGITQQGAHLELARFPIATDSILQRPTFFLARPLQNEDYTRNLVPPPQRARPNQQKGKVDTKISLYAFKEGPATDASSNVPQFGNRPSQFLPQASPTFEYASQQQKPQKVKEQAVDVQVTKENLKQYTQGVAPSPFGNVPGRNGFPVEYEDYAFQSPRPSGAPNPLTYEVTEGKWLDTPSQQYQFRPQDAFFQYQNIRQPGLPNARPGLLFQPVSSSGPPPIFQAPIVDLNVSPFLPTPYKPETVVAPTSATQNEASTVFNKVSNKMNKLRNNALKENAFTFEIKEVSTHYPILGKPEYQTEGGTDTPLPINDNGEISNEITTTQKERDKPRRPITSLPATPPTSIRDPTRARINNRRRPRPKTPITTTTTTEEPVVVESYESMKSQENIEDTPAVETERPVRRRRPRPPSYAQNSEGQESESSKQSGEDVFNRQRGRYRFRSRDRTTERTDTNQAQRKRLRPSYERFEEPTESSMEPENYPVFPPQDNLRQPNEEASKIETENVPEQSIQQENRPFIEEVPTTQRVRFMSTTEQESNTHFHAPENEVDYSTQAQAVHEEVTTQPPTTTEQPSTSTVKFTRARRPTKYDTSNRPRFSVKEYRQKLSQYSSTTPVPTLTPSRTVTENTLRIRFPSRLRTRPTTASSRIDEDVTDEYPSSSTPTRSRFRPKEPKYDSTTTESSEIITERSVKAVNTRLRPFGRTKNPTAETTTASSKISIRPNLFSARRRTGYPSLKTRIQSRQKKNETEEMEVEETTEGDPLNVAESATTEEVSTITRVEHEDDISTEVIIEESVTEDAMKSDDYVVSQRVSDLTSSFKGYDKPGAFNSVGPTSRSIPNHFTLSTDDPILPIEAFFPSLKEKSKER